MTVADDIREETPASVWVSWYDHDCDWITKHCDEYHQKSARVPLALLEDPDGYLARIRAEAWQAGWDQAQNAVGDPGEDANPYHPSPSNDRQEQDRG
jgi:hypothetical protein